MAVGDGWQVTIPDETGLSGQRLAEIVRWLATTISASWVAVTGVEGAGSSIAAMVADDSSTLVFPVDEFLRHAGGVLQFDWGDFFLCASREAANSILAGEDYSRSVSKSAATVRAVDDVDFFVYGQDEALLGEVRARFPNGEWRRGALDELEFPE